MKSEGQTKGQKGNPQRIRIIFARPASSMPQEAADFAATISQKLPLPPHELQLLEWGRAGEGWGGAEQRRASVRPRGKGLGANVWELPTTAI